MNDRDRFRAQMHFQPRDRSVIWDFSFWDETLPIWHGQGLPPEVSRANSDVFFGMDPSATWAPVNMGLCPAFEAMQLEDRGDHEVVQQPDGVRVLRKKFMGSIPQHEGHLLVDRESWNRHYRWRLDPDHPDRLPRDWEQRRAALADPDRSFVLTCNGGSLYGWLRDWMGMEAISLLVYDDPGLFEEMVTTVADCVIATLGRMLADGIRPDLCNLWEDMCYNAGPLLGPEQFKRYLVPHYRRISDLLRRHGCDVIVLDCDGRIDDLIPLWLDAGINCMFPIEIGTWGADPLRYRQQYGRDLLLMGGFDKHLLARGPREIAAEVRRLAPLVEQGGYIGFCDHRVPPDVPLVNYLHYLEQVRAVWGHGVNLRPVDSALTQLLRSKAG